MAILAEEVGEVARAIIARTDGEQSAKAGERLDLCRQACRHPVGAARHSEPAQHRHGWRFRQQCVEKKNVQDCKRHKQNKKITS